jgi:simple sugar transport system permease protein
MAPCGAPGEERAVSATSDATIIVAGLLSSTPPLLFAGCGEYVAERAGTLNISVEAMMLAGAYTAVVGDDVTGSSALGLVLGMLAGLAVALVHANFSHRLAANTFVVGLTLDALVLGLTDYFSSSFPQIAATRMDPTAVPVLHAIPVLGSTLFDSPWPVYLLFAVVPATWWLVERSHVGLELRSCGESPEAADATGTRVNLRRRQALGLCGVLSGLGGAYLALAVVGAFNQDMTDGIGYVVIAAVIFGGWTLRGTVLGCVVFGGASALQLALPALGISVNGDAMIALPYVAALVAMVFLAKRHRAPRALARPFVRGVL